MEDNKKKDIESVIKTLEKQVGKGVVSFGDIGFDEMARFPSGSLKLDMILGGGWPVGRIVEVYGPESSGKTSTALLTVSKLQSLGKVCAYIDVEQALNPKWMSLLGVKLDELIFVQPNSGEDALDIVKELTKSGQVDFIVVDSVADLVPQAELDGDLGDASIGLQARLMSKALRSITGEANKNNCTILFINQLREKIGVMFGNPETTTGGKALKFYSSIRLDVRKEFIKEGSETVGQKIKFKTVKNKTYPPYKNTEITLIFNQGFDEVRELLSIAINMGHINKAGAWYSFGDEKLGNGESRAVEYLKEHQDVLDRVKTLVYADLGYVDENGEIKDA